MKKIKWLMTVLIITIMALLLVACGGEETSKEDVETYSPIEIQVEDAGDGTSVFSVIYDIDAHNKEQWTGYPENEREMNTALEGIKQCMERDDWTDGSVIYGYGGETLLKNIIYSYGYDGSDGNYNSIKFFQLGIYNTTYQLTGELD